MESFVRDAKAFQGNERRWLEDSLGQSLREDQKVFIMAFTPGVPPDGTARQKAKKSLHQIFSKAEAHARQNGITQQQIDEAIDEAMSQERGTS